MKWLGFIGPVGAVLLVAGSALATGRLVAAVAAILIGIAWYRADRAGSSESATACFFVLCVIAIGALAAPAFVGFAAALGVAAAIVGHDLSRFRATARGAEGPTELILRRRAIEAASVVVPVATIGFLVGRVQATVGFWSIFAVSLLALVGLNVILRRVQR
ncbi:MAG: hypothetical protein EA426_02920 [Spirochaetaceae bacterium]|nr:MAG: hypothetical protein EA426_02920 [Spirochaetaceae bacterium]